MARKKKKGGGGGGAGWLVTFSDLMTLLLTFFVLLLSMASMDTPLLTRISTTRDNPSPINDSGGGKVSNEIKLLLEIIAEPENINQNRDRIKDLLFPNEILPTEISPGKLEENLRILAHPEGVVLVLTEALLFPRGAYTLAEPGRRLLEALLPVLHYSSADMNIAAHTDNQEDSALMDDYELSGRRAISVLEYFLQQGFKASRFSISGYGPDKPLEPNTTEKGRAQNRRVELLLKTTQWLGRYL